MSQEIFAHCKSSASKEMHGVGKWNEDEAAQGWINGTREWEIEAREEKKKLEKHIFFLHTIAIPNYRNHPQNK